MMLKLQTTSGLRNGTMETQTNAGLDCIVKPQRLDDATRDKRIGNVIVPQTYRGRSHCFNKLAVIFVVNKSDNYLITFDDFLLRFWFLEFKSK